MAAKNLEWVMSAWLQWRSTNAKKDKNGKLVRNSSATIWTDGRTVYSYDTPILCLCKHSAATPYAIVAVPMAKAMGDSATTNKHISQVKKWFIDTSWNMGPTSMKVIKLLSEDKELTFDEAWIMTDADAYRK